MADPTGHEFHTQLQLPLRWVRRLALFLLFFASVQPIGLALYLRSYTSAPAVVDMDRRSVARAELADARSVLWERLEAASSRVSGTEVALANWCVSQETDPCRWGEYTLTQRRSGEIVRTLKGQFPVRAGASSSEIEWAQDAVRDAEEALVQAETPRLPKPYPLLDLIRLALICGIAFLFCLVSGLALLSVRRPFEVSLNSAFVQLGSHRIAAAEIVGCHVDGGALVVRLSGRRRIVTPRLVASPAQLDEVVDLIGRIALPPEERAEEARARVEIRRRLAELAQDLPTSPEGR